jgi:hypothetical protein
MTVAATVLFCASEGDLALKTGSRQLFQLLPKRLALRIQKLAERTGEKPVEIVKKGIDLYERYGVLSAENETEQTRLSRIEPDPEKRTVFSEVMRAMANRTNAVMTKEQRQERGRKGALKRWGTKKEDPTPPKKES